MAKKKKRGPRLCARMPPGFYQNEALYWSGRTMELENFRRVVLLSEDTLCVEMGWGSLTIKGAGLAVSALEPGRLLVRGKFMQVSFAEYGARQKGE